MFAFIDFHPNFLAADNLRYPNINSNSNEVDLEEPHEDGASCPSFDKDVYKSSASDSLSTRLSKNGRIDSTGTSNITCFLRVNAFIYVDCSRA